MNHPDGGLAHTHDPWLVAVSIIIAVLASYATLELAARVTAASGRRRLAWLASGAVVMGTGIWSMHFVAMLAFQLPIPVSYDSLWVAISWLAAVFASGVALIIVSRPALSWRSLGAGGLIMGAAISGMHYLGMAAMRLSARISYDPGWVTASVLIAIGASVAALWLAFRLRVITSWAQRLLKGGAALVMGAAIAGMHYTAMAAAQFVADPSLPANPPGSVSIPFLGVVALIAGTVLVLGVAILLSVMDQWLARLTYPQKFVFISALFAVPLLVVTSLFALELSDRIDRYGYREQAGNQYLRPLQALLGDLQQHQQLMARLSTGQASTMELSAVEAQIDGHFENLRRLDNTYRSLLLTGNRLAALETKWRALKAQAAHMGQQDRDTEYLLLISQLQDLVTYVGNTSYLILDPALDTYYMMDAVLLKLPESQVQLGRVYQTADTVLRTRPDDLSPTDKSDLLIGSGLLRANVDELTRNLETAFQSDATGQMRAATAEVLRSRSDAVLAFNEVMEQRLAGAVHPDLDRDTLAAAANRALIANQRLYDAASLALEGGLQRRITDLTNREYGLIGFSVLFALIPFLIGLSVMRAISRPLRQLTRATQQLAAGDMAVRIPVTSPDEVGRVGASFNSMAEELQASAAVAQARTRDLTLAVEIGRILAQERDLTILLPQAVELIRARFGLYHVQVYLVDPVRRQLDLRASTGEAGQTLLRRNHRLPMDQYSINGAAAVNGQPVLIADTHNSSTFRPNALLPETRSEMAIPLVVNERVIGVLDLQSAEAGGLSPDNRAAFAVLASQLANAVNNSVLFNALEQARNEVEAQARRLTRAGWQDFLDAIHRQEQIEQTFSQTETYEPGAATFTVPLEIAGQTVGTLMVEGDAQHAWTPDEIGLARNVARQAARQVENLRLLAQAEQYRAEAEQVIQRLSREAWTAYVARQTGDLAPEYVYDAAMVQRAEATAGVEPAGLVQPLEIHGQAFGELAVESDHLPPEAAALVAAVADRLSHHLEDLRLTEETRSALAQTEQLYDMAAQLSEAATLTEVLHVIAGLRGAAGATLMTLEVDAAGQPETLIIAAGWPPNRAAAGPAGTRFPVQQFGAAQAWIEHPDEPALFADMTTDARLDAFTRDFNRKMGVLASVYLPLQTGNRWVGVIALAWDTIQTFNEADRQLYRAVAAQAAVVVNNRLLFEQTRKRADREAIINTISQRIQSATSVDGAIQTAAREIGQLLKARRAVVELGGAAGDGSPQGNGHGNGGGNGNGNGHDHRLPAGPAGLDVGD